MSDDISAYNNTLEAEIQKLLNIYNNKAGDKNYQLEEIRNHLLF